MLSYTVNHSFAHKGKLYNRANAEEVKKLPREVRDAQIALGHLTEHDDRGSAAEPAAPAHTSGGGK